MGKDGKQKNKDYASCLSGGAHSGGNHSDMDLIQVGTLRTHKDGNGFREVQGGNCRTIPARAREDGSGQLVIAIYDFNGNRNGGHMTSRTHTDGLVRALKASRSGTSDPMAEFADKRIRRLTPIECERLQGCKDNHTKFGRYGDEVKEISDTQRYKGLGNSFTVNVIEAIVSRMIEKGCLVCE